MKETKEKAIKFKVIMKPDLMATLLSIPHGTTAVFDRKELCCTEGALISSVHRANRSCDTKEYRCHISKDGATCTVVRL